MQSRSAEFSAYHAHTRPIRGDLLNINKRRLPANPPKLLLANELFATTRQGYGVLDSLLFASPSRRIYTRAAAESHCQCAPGKFILLLHVWINKKPSCTRSRRATTPGAMLRRDFTHILVAWNEKINFKFVRNTNSRLIFIYSAGMHTKWQFSLMCPLRKLKVT